MEPDIYNIALKILKRILYVYFVLLNIVKPLLPRARQKKFIPWIVFALCFCLSFALLLFSGSPLFFAAVFLYGISRYSARRKTRHSLYGVLYFFSSIPFGILLTGHFLASLAMAYSIQSSIIAIDFAVCIAAAFFIQSIRQIKKRSFTLHPVIITGILTLIHCLTLTVLTQKNESQFLRTLSQDAIHPVALSLDRRSTFSRNFIRFPHFFDSLPTSLVSDLREHSLFLTTHVKGDRRHKYNALYRLSLDGGKILSLPAHDLRGIAMDSISGRLFVCNRGERSLLVVDPEHFTLITSIPVAADFQKRTRARNVSVMLNRPETVLVDARRQQLLVMLEGGALLSYDLRTLKLKRYRKLPCNPVSARLSADSRTLLIGCTPDISGRANGLLAVDAASLKLKKKTGRFWFCRGLALSRDASTLYYADMLHGVIRMIDTKDLRVKDTLRVGPGLRAMTIDPELPYLYTGSFTRGYFYVIELQTKKILKKLYVGRQIRDISMTDKTGRLFVTTSLGVFEILKDKLLPR